MKLIQLNIWQGRLLKEVINFLKTEQPDIICLQEVYRSDIDSPLFDYLRSYEHILATFPGYQGFFSPAYDMAMLGSTFEFGNAIISRFPLQDQETFFINGEHESHFTLDTYVPNSRVLQRTTVQAPDGKHLTLLNHHGYWEPTPIGSDITVEKLQKVADVAKNGPMPLILSGDLNVTAASPAMKSIHQLLRDLTQEYDLKDTLSSLGKVSGVACDHICVSEGITVRSFAKRETLVSDHQALVLEFDLA